MKRLMTTAATVIALSAAAQAQQTGGAFTDYQVQPGQDLFASELMGSRLYSTEGEVSGPVESSETGEWNDLGEINDLVLSEDGSVEVVVVGIGGFLGIGERDAAVSMDQLQIVRNSADEADYFLVINATQEEIENAPEFERDPNAGAGPTGTASTGTNAEATGDSDTGEVEVIDPGTDSAEQNMEDAGDSLENAAESTGDAVEDTGQAAEDAAEDATGNN